VPANDRAGIRIKQPGTEAERQAVAATCVAKLELSMPCVIDGLDNKVGETYSGWPDRLYLIDKTGTIAYKSGPGPAGFKVDELAARLKALLGK